ncbi:auxin-responsive protein SAUR50 [Tanacetum coccineum]
MCNMSRKNTIAMMVEKLQRRLFVKHIDGVPQDVKQGHLAVIAVDGYDERRFVVPVSYLKHDSFVRLMEQAAEVYGFDHERAVVIPCRPSELERMLVEIEAKEKIRLCMDLQLEWAEALIEEAVGTLFSWCEHFGCYNHDIWNCMLSNEQKHLSFVYPENFALGGETSNEWPLSASRCVSQPDWSAVIVINHYQTNGHYQFRPPCLLGTSVNTYPLVDLESFMSDIQLHHCRPSDNAAGCLS